METMTDFTYFFLGALTLFFGIIAKPHVDKLVARIKRLFTRNNSKIDINDVVDIVSNMEDDISYLQKQIDDNQTQITNLAERLSNRDTNRRNNVRRDVRSYLEEIKNGK